MDTNVLNQKMYALTEDKEFMQFLFEQDSYEKIQMALESKDVELSIEEVKTLVANVLSQLENKDAELDENELENISGGIIAAATIVGLAKVGVVVTMSVAGGVIGWKLAGKKK